MTNISTNQKVPQTTAQTTLRFPEGFLWGSATSSHQVEGGNHNDWTDWEAQAGRIKDGSNASRACDHYHLYESDFALAKSLGQNAHRLSLEWSRIEPEEGRWDLTEVMHYRRVLLALRAQGLKSFVTCWHFTLPKWFAAQGGWEHPDAPRLFARYCAFVAREYGDLVDVWTTINEPMVFLGMGYIDGYWPPGRQLAIGSALRAFRRLCQGHRLAYRAMHQVLDAAGRPAQIGIAQNCQALEPYDRRSALDKVCVRLADYVFNHVFFSWTRGTHDYLGVNYYFHHRLKVVSRRLSPLCYIVRDESQDLSDLGWVIHPEGLFHVLQSLRRYRLPIYVTENGVADAADRLRPRFLRNMIAEMHRAVQAGADVRGYFHWSLLDNFEWDKGLTPCFGLVAVDYETLRRTPRRSAYAYQQICEDNGLSS